MNLTRWLLLVFGLLILIGAADLATHYPQLPEKVATHFNAEGQADGWGSKTGFLQQYVLLMLILTITFPGCLWLLPMIPRSMINIPNKEYWMTPERFPIAQSIVAVYMLGFGVTTLAFMVFVMHLVMRANLSSTLSLGTAMWIGLAVYLVLDLLIFVGMMLRFKQVKD